MQDHMEIIREERTIKELFKINHLRAALFSGKERTIKAGKKTLKGICAGR